MKKYSANYSHSNHNFVIQNLYGQRINNEYLPAICILKNILQRGKPTLLSSFLQKELGQLHRQNDFNKAYPLIDKEPPKWERIIKGDENHNYFPAKKFYEEFIPKYLSEYKFIQQLLIPEIEINEITQVEVQNFINQQVDFYLPQAYLIIEIDGSQHIEQAQLTLDITRDAHTKKYGIETIRIQVSDLEAENNTFTQRMQEIEDRIEEAILGQVQHKNSIPTFISIEDYKSSFQNGIDLDNSNYKATAIIRFQILVLELLENGLLSFQNNWDFEIIERDISNFAKIAIEDLMIWFQHILKLHKIDFDSPEFSIKKCNFIEEFSNNTETIKIDFSLLKRYTDGFQTQPNIIFVRTDYLDEYRYYKNGNAGNLTFSAFEQYDYFKICTTETIKYQLKIGDQNSDKQSLLFLLWNIFLQNDDSLDFKSLEFREGQLPIIANALTKNDTIGLLPTGSGKSVCYQLAAILQPAISFVVCPIKSLMYDQKADLNSVFFSRVNHITSDDDGQDKEKIQNEFANGKYFFIFISPERFQLKTFRQYFSLVNEDFNIAYAVIDEVHCLSEWGHDFRTSYLNLADTIKRYCTNFNYIGLTATASINVLKDIQNEFDIKSENVKTPVNYTREELEFIVIDDKNNKSNAIISQLENLKQTIDAFKIDGSETKCGIIFTPNVNGNNGCYNLSQTLSKHFQSEIKYYSGKIPTVNNQEIMTRKEFDKYKIDVQNDFKNNKFPLLTATKAFGMGVNKGNIHYTIHYGIPGSMEALYQEAGRAGRDKTKFAKEKAKCIVLLSKSNDDNLLSEIWDRNTMLSRIARIQKNVRGDINTNLFLYTSGLTIIKDEHKIIKNLYLNFAVPIEQEVKVTSKKLNTNKAKTEKAIYRLKQLGIVKDWTIINFFTGEFEVDFTEFSEQTIKDSLLKTINKYDKEFSFENAKDTYRKILNKPNIDIIDKYIFILLQWSYNNFAYNRRQSLKTIYENSCKFANGEITSEEFKTTLEDYFKFSQSSYTLQHIAENPKDFKKWFEVFYEIDSKTNKISNAFINRRNQESLRDNLSRFLESYMYNTGLDLISGISRLLLNDYDNDDGRKRFESAMEQIKNYEYDNRDFIICQILILGKELDNNNRDNLSKSLLKFFDTKEFLIRLANELGDEYSAKILVANSIYKLKIISKRIYGRF